MIHEGRKNSLKGRNIVLAMLISPLVAHANHDSTNW